MLLLTVNFNQFSESKCLGAKNHGNSPAPSQFEFVKRWPFYSPFSVSGGKNTPNSDLARASDEFQIQAETRTQKKELTAHRKHKCLQKPNLAKKNFIDRLFTVKRVLYVVLL